MKKEIYRLGEGQKKFILVPTNEKVCVCVFNNEVESNIHERFSKYSWKHNFFLLKLILNSRNNQTSGFDLPPRSTVGNVSAFLSSWISTM